MLRYAKYKGAVSTDDLTAKLNYADIEKISDWAQNGVMYCTSKGIMQGRDNNMFLPGDNTTRAEAAAILRRFSEIR